MIGQAFAPINSTPSGIAFGSEALQAQWFLDSAPLTIKAEEAAHARAR
jgi:hypothetical protein